MEAVRLTYKILFSLEIVLQGYPDDVNQYFRVLPDEATQKLLSQYGMLMRKQKNTTVSLIEVENTVTDFGEPVVPLEDNEIFRFNVKCTDLGFLARTHLASYDFNTGVLLLSNEVNHVSGSDVLLTRPVAVYNSGHEYKPGYVVRSGSNYYRAIRASSSGDAHGVTETDYWRNIPAGVYASQADLQARPLTADRDSIMFIEIRHSAALPDTYKLLDLDSKCREVTYRIKLLM